MLKRPDPSRTYGPPKKRIDDQELKTNFPTLYLYLTQERWDSGDPRLTATMTVYVNDGSLTVVLNDRHNNRSLFANEASLFSAMAALEDHLAADTGDWKSRKAAAQTQNIPPF